MWCMHITQGIAELFVDIYAKLNFLIIVLLSSWFSCSPPWGSSGGQTGKVAWLSSIDRQPRSRKCRWDVAPSPQRPPWSQHFLLDQPTHTVCHPCWHHLVTEAYDNVACDLAQIKLWSGQKFCLPIFSKDTMTLSKVFV